MCYTCYLFTGDKAELEKLHDFVEDNISDVTTRMKPFADWMGNLLCAIGSMRGIEDKELLNAEISEIEFVVPYRNGYCLMLETATMNLPLADVWEEIITALNLNTIKYAYRSEDAYVDGIIQNVKYDPHKLFVGDGNYFVSYYLHNKQGDCFVCEGRFYDADAVKLEMSRITGVNTFKWETMGKLESMVDAYIENNDLKEDYVFIISYEPIIKSTTKVSAEKSA